MMRTYFRLLLLCSLAAAPASKGSAGEPFPKDGKAGPEVPSVETILREASELALKQGENERYWTQTLLPSIGELQSRAGDFESAFRSIRGSNYPYARESALRNLVQALARAGKKERAIEVSRLSDLSWFGLDTFLDSVLLGWVEHLIAKGDLRQAVTEVDHIKADWVRRDALQKVAVAFARLNDAGQSNQYFTQAREAAAKSKDEYHRARALWEIGEAQRLIGFPDAARVTLRQLARIAEELNEPWAKVSALRESAVLAARLKDRDFAQSQFGQALKARPTRGQNVFRALQQIASAQASVGFIEDAKKTAALIEPSEKEWWGEGDRSLALYSIAVGQLDAGDADGAIDTARLIKRFLQYRDDALKDVVAFQIGKKDLKVALATTEKFENPSRKATAILRVAAAQAKAGDWKAAAETAAQIKLTHRSEMRKLLGGEESAFDYRRPESWGDNYDAHDFFTMTSHMATLRHTAEVAAAAMELAQTLEYKPPQSYAVLFKDFNSEQVTQSLARTHATFGDVNEAIAWAKQIGSADKIPEEDKNRVSWAVQQRIHALLGVAEGMLDRVKRQ